MGTSCCTGPASASVKSSPALAGREPKKRGLPHPTESSARELWVSAASCPIGSLRFRWYLYAVRPIQLGSDFYGTSSPPGLVLDM